MGLSPKYYGPFRIVGINKNGCDYLIKRLNSPRARTKQVHKTNLKIYYDGGIEEVENINSLANESQPAITITKRAYHKDPSNQRWNKNPAAIDSESSALSDSEPHKEVLTTVPDGDKTSDEETLPAKPKRKYTKNPNAPRWNMKGVNETLVQTAGTPNTALNKDITRTSMRGRSLKPPERFQ